MDEENSSCKCKCDLNDVPVIGSIIAYELAVVPVIGSVIAYVLAIVILLIFILWNLVNSVNNQIMILKQSTEEN